MEQIKAHIAVSLDGHTATPDYELDWMPREEKEKRKERELVNVAHDIFGRQTRITYIDLCEQLQQVLDIKERTAKSYIRFMRERDIITKDTANQSCFVIGSYHLQRNASCP